MFNDENDPCNVMVATDAIGMGLNLNIRRVIFSSLRKVDINAEGKKTLESISVSQALQIAGRAGRSGTQYPEGFVTTYLHKDLKVLKSLLSSTPALAEKAGLYPTAEQIEMFAYHLPDSSLTSLLEIFTDMSQMDDSLYFMCNIEAFKFLADKMDAIRLPLRARYIFCCAPVNINDSIVVSMVVKMAAQYGRNKVLNATWLADQLKWPAPVPENIADLSKLESFHDVIDLYLWLSLRFSDLFTDRDEVKKMRSALDDTILDGLIRLSKMMVSDPEVEESELANIDFRKQRELRHTGSLARDLIKTGAVSPEILDRL